MIRFTLLLVLATAGAQAASAPAIEGQRGMVVTSQRLASEVGADILRRGGNAIDAAVAVGYALAVVNPCCGNIGGGGFMTLHLANASKEGGRDRFINFRETAPGAATATMFLNADGKPIPDSSLYGSRAAGVPGTVMGLEHARVTYGTMDRAALLAPAIALAQDGFILSRPDTDILDSKADRFRASPSAGRIFLAPDGTNWRPGERLRQPELGQTLRDIAAQGTDGFYRGRIPAAIAATAQRDGGILTAADLAAYTITDTAPLTCGYRGTVILSAPPPSSGGTTICEILQILSGYDLRAMGWHGAQSVHVMAEAMRHAFLDRNTYLGDPAFVTNPIERLTSSAYAAAIRAQITDQATPSATLRPGTAPHEKTETTHYSIVDTAGNAVAVTYTINGSFGAVVVPDGTGFLLNDEMDDFTIKPGVPNLFGLVQGDANAIAPGKRPLSSMSPTIVTRDGRTILVAGSPGGSRIISIVMQVIVNMLDHGMAPMEAVDAPRIHHQWLPDVLFTEPYGLSPDTLALLRARGHTVTEQVPWGAAEVIAVGVAPTAGSGQAPSDSALSGRMRPGFLYGANDDRRPAGSAVAE